jgi:hypothetical protein
MANGTRVIQNQNPFGSPAWAGGGRPPLMGRPIRAAQVPQIGGLGGGIRAAQVPQIGPAAAGAPPAMPPYGADIRRNMVGGMLSPVAGAGAPAAAGLALPWGAPPAGWSPYGHVGGPVQAMQVSPGMAGGAVRAAQVTPGMGMAPTDHLGLLLHALRSNPNVSGAASYL